MQSPARSPRRRQRLRSCAASTPSLQAADAMVKSVACGAVATASVGGTGAGACGVGRSEGPELVAGMPVWIARSQSGFDADLCPTFVRDPSGPDRIWTVRGPSLPRHLEVVADRAPARGVVIDERRVLARKVAIQIAEPGRARRR
jgi:hypothetical protein